MFDSPILDAIESIYSSIAEYKECNEDIIKILISLHCYINKPPHVESIEQKNIRLNSIDIVIHNRVKRVIDFGIEE